MTTEKVKRVLIVGQTPPPYFGQAIMIQRTVEAPFTKVKVVHVRMAFSKKTSEVSKFNFYKIVHLFQLIFKTIYYRFKYKTPTLYYIPVGSSFVPLMRDIIFLLPVRLFFPRVVFHFRACGIYDYVLRQKKFLQFFAQLAYKKPDLSIHLTTRNNEFRYLQGKTRQAVVPNGAKDYCVEGNHNPVRNGKTILFVSILREEKGLTDLIKACAMLRKKGIDFKVDVLGDFYSEKYRTEIMHMVESGGMKEQICFHGVKVDEAKFAFFTQSDIFCYPSYHDVLPNVVMEAMMFGLPVVSTDYAGIPDFVLDNQTGFLVPVKNPEKIAEKLELLLSDKQLSATMGANGRERYLNEFTIEQYYQRMEESLFSV